MCLQARNGLLEPHVRLNRLLRRKKAWLKISQCADALEGQLDSMELDATGDCGAAKQQQPVGLQRSHSSCADGIRVRFECGRWWLLHWGRCSSNVFIIIFQSKHRWQ